MAMDTNDLNWPLLLEGNLGKLENQQLNAPPNFTPANNAFASFMSHPSLMRGPGGGIMDPRTQQNTMGSNWLQERGDIAQQSLTDKDKLAQMLLGVGSSMGNIFASKIGLNAQQIGSGGGIF